MKTLPLILAAVVAFSSQGAPAQARDHCTITNMSFGDSPAHWGPRHDVGSARIAITEDRGKATMLLTDRLVAIQLSDRTLHQLDRRMRDKMDDDGDDEALGHALKAVVFSGVLAMLNSSAEFRIRDIRDITYENGRIVVMTRSGERVLQHVDIDDDDLMRGFSESDARQFIREFHRAQADLR